jgi:hypothetical protein
MNVLMGEVRSRKKDMVWVDEVVEHAELRLCIMCSDFGKQQS